MASFKVIKSGDVELDKMLQRLISPQRQRRFHAVALRKSAKVILDWAKHTIPRRTGALRSSLAVRAFRRSRKRFGYFVVQKEPNAKGNDRSKAYYGSFVELGYRATGRRKKDSRSDIDKLVNESSDLFKEKTRRTITREITTYRGQTFTIAQLRQARHVKARWLMRKAGIAKEDEARGIYVAELRQLIEQGARG